MIHRSSKRLSLHQWHVIRVTRTGYLGTLKIDDEPEIQGQAKGAYTQLTLLQNLYLGGHVNFDHTSKHANISSSFVGCIQKVSRIHKKKIHIMFKNNEAHIVCQC